MKKFLAILIITVVATTTVFAVEPAGQVKSHDSFEFKVTAGVTEGCAFGFTTTDPSTFITWTDYEAANGYSSELLPLPTGFETCPASITLDKADDGKTFTNSSNPVWVFCINRNGANKGIDVKISGTPLSTVNSSWSANDTMEYTVSVDGEVKITVNETDQPAATLAMQVGVPTNANSFITHNEAAVVIKTTEGIPAKTQLNSVFKATLTATVIVTE